MSIELFRSATFTRSAAPVIGLLLLLGTAYASAESPHDTRSSSQPQTDSQTIYKGVVGNLLDSVPLPPEDRLQLQRANAVLSSPLTARTVAAALGIANPPLMLVGLIWGLWSASQIKPAHTARESAEPVAKQSALTADHGALSPPPRFASIAAPSDTPAGRVGSEPADSAVPVGTGEVKEMAAELAHAPLEFGKGYAPVSALSTISGAAMPAAEDALRCATCYLPALSLHAIPVAR